jgi:hypothetical protein
VSTEQIASASAQSAQATAKTRDVWFRLLGVLPLVFFMGQAVHYWRFGGFGNMLWMCNIGNLLLAIGLFIGHREVIRVAAIWMIPGLGVWIRYVLVESGFRLTGTSTSTLAHVGGFAIALVALRQVRVDRIAWLYAFVWYLVMQLVSRLTTSPDLNVNVASRIQSGWNGKFASYWKFWLVMSALVAATLWAIEMILYQVWPASQNRLR